jgi:predicted Zn-dependent peptidase
MKRILIVLGLVMAFIAQPGIASDKIKPVRYGFDTLSNGLRIIYYVDKTVPLVTTVVYYNVGSSDEITGQHGYAHFFEHLMFEATNDIPRAYIDKYTEEAGGTNNAYTSFDETVYHFKVPANEIKLPLWIEAQRMRGLRVDTIGVETQRGVVLEEMKQRNDNTPYGSAYNILVSKLFPGTRYSWTPIGDADNIKNARNEDFRNFYNQNYLPSNAVLVIAGNIDIPIVRGYVEEYFGGLPMQKPQPKKDTIIAPLVQAYREQIVDPKAELPAVYIGFRSVSLKDSNYYAVELLNKILGSGNSSRLYKRLVDKEQAAIEVAAEAITFNYSGGTLFYALASGESETEDIEEMILEELNNIIKNGISDEELTKVKNISESGFIYARKNLLTLATALASSTVLYGTPESVNTEIDKYLKVTKEDIQRVAKTYFSSDKRVTLIYKPSAQ